MPHPLQDAINTELARESINNFRSSHLVFFSTNSTAPIRQRTIGLGSNKPSKITKVATGSGSELSRPIVSWSWDLISFNT